MSIEFYFEERAVIDMWIIKLRGLCLMCDFTSMYSMGTVLNKSSLFRVRKSSVMTKFCVGILGTKQN